MTAPKQPVSVLVVIHTPALEILLLERAAHSGFWQSVTGSREGNEALSETARREVLEETGIDAPLADFSDWSLSNSFEIFSEWRHRYAPGVTHNVEHVFSLCISAPIEVTTSACRASCLAMATLEGSGRPLLFLDQPGCHPVTAGTDSSQLLKPAEPLLYWDQESLINQGGNHGKHRSHRPVRRPVPRLLRSPR
jgi:dATP pyrophosphohydrolase